MAKKAEQENAPDVLGQFNALKQKHPDAMLLFRKGDFYEMYREDAVKAAAVLAITLTSRTFRGGKEPVKFASFPYHALDVYLPKLIRSGLRVAICDQLETPKLKKEEQSKQEIKDKFKVKEEIIPNNTDMAKKKKEEPLDFENMTPEELLKYEIADEIGLGDKILKGGWKSLTSKESGRIGGLMTKRKRELKREALENDVAVQKIPIREQ